MTYENSQNVRAMAKACLELPSEELGIQWETVGRLSGPGVPTNTRGEGTRK